MNILMMTNAYKPLVGGVERSLEIFTDAYRARGHRVLIVAPDQPRCDPAETDVVRVPAICNFNGTDFSVRLPVPGALDTALADFRPDIVHSHHPFLIGDTALRVAARCRIPIVYTNHTFYERYTHYVPIDSPAMKRFVVSLSTAYANLCDRVFAPSESVAAIIKDRGVETPVDIVPTGIHVEDFQRGDGRGFRKKHGIPEEGFLVGFVSRIAPEKNMAFLSEAVAEVLAEETRAHFLLVGSGPSRDEVLALFRSAGCAERVCAAGTLQGRDLADAFHAMDVFVFASLSETQGIVLAEAMSAGVPVIALDAPGVREVVEENHNGRLVCDRTVRSFAEAVRGVMHLPPQEAQRLGTRAIETAKRFSIDRCAEDALSAYGDLTAAGGAYTGEEQDTMWEDAKRKIRAEWDLLAAKSTAAGDVFAAE